MGKSPIAVRGITPEEHAVMFRAVQVGGIEGADIPSLDDLHSLQVVGRCECGCDSLDFRHLRPGQIPSLVADATGETLTGECVGILVFAYEGQFTGLEIVSYSDGPAPLPVLSTIRA